MNIEKILKRANLSWPESEKEELKINFQEILEKINKLQVFELVKMEEKFATLEEDQENKLAKESFLKYLNTENDKFSI